MLHIVKRPFKYGIDQRIPQGRNVIDFLNYSIHVFFMYPPNNTRLNRFNGNRAWNVFSETFYRRYYVVFKEELKSNVLSVVVETIRGYNPFQSGIIFLKFRPRLKV